MTEQQQHLQSVIQQGQELAEAINKLNAQITEKRAMLTKLQGVAEYLDQIGVKLPEKTEEEAPAAPEVVAPTEVVEEGE
jgi:prefoldin subunit 5